MDNITQEHKLAHGLFEALYEHELWDDLTSIFLALRHDKTEDVSLTVEPLNQCWRLLDPAIVWKLWHERWASLEEKERTITTLTHCIFTCVKEHNPEGLLNHRESNALTTSVGTGNSTIEGSMKTNAKQLKKESDPTVEGAEIAAKYIIKGAKLIEKGLKEHSTPLVTSGLDLAARVAMDNIELAPPPSCPTCDQTRNPNEFAKSRNNKNNNGHDSNIKPITTYTNAARRSTGVVKEFAEYATFGIRDAATRGIQDMATKIDEADVVADRELLVSVGKVGLASLGAMAIVTEAVFDSTRTVFNKSVDVTSDVVRHKFGDTAGQAVKDTGNTIGNVMRTVMLVTMIVDGTTMAKVIAKNTGKVSTPNVEDEEKIKGSKNNVVSTQNVGEKKIKDGKSEVIFI